MKKSLRITSMVILILSLFTVSTFAYGTWEREYPSSGSDKFYPYGQSRSSTLSVDIWYSTKTYTDYAVGKSSASVDFDTISVKIDTYDSDGTHLDWAHDTNVYTDHAEARAYNFTMSTAGDYAKSYHFFQKNGPSAEYYTEDGWFY